jgi:hypothetical protein
MGKKGQRNGQPKASTREGLSQFGSGLSGKRMPGQGYCRVLAYSLGNPVAYNLNVLIGKPGGAAQSRTHRPVLAPVNFYYTATHAMVADLYRSYSLTAEAQVSSGRAPFSNLTSLEYCSIAFPRSLYTILYLIFCRETQKKVVTNPSLPLQMLCTRISPTTSVKILGVILDRRLNFKQHMAKTAFKGLKAALALRRLKGLRSGVARQLFTSKVAPVVDYAFPL